MSPSSAKSGPAPVERAILASYFVLALLGLVWPGYEWLGNRLKPQILGLPLSLAWNVGWVGLTFLVMGVWYLRHDARRHDDSSSSR